MSGQVVGYVRVSSVEQNTARLVAALGEVEETFTDRVSGKRRGDRLALATMLRHVRRGNTVRVTSMDRLARSVVDLAQLVQEITGRGIRVERHRAPGLRPRHRRSLRYVPAAPARCRRPARAFPDSGAQARGHRSPKPRVSTEVGPASSPRNRSPTPGTGSRPESRRRRSRGSSAVPAVCSMTSCRLEALTHRRRSSTPWR